MDLVSVSLFALVLSLIALWARIRKQKFSIFKRNGIPGPDPSFWTGNFKDIAKKKEECLLEYMKQFGRTFGIFLGAIPLLIVTDEELIKTIQVKDFEKFIEREPILEGFGIPHSGIAESLFASRGEDWKRKRVLASRSFSAKKLKKILPIVNETTEIFMERLRESCDMEFVNIVTLFRNLTLDITTKAFIGIDTGVQNAARSKILDSTHLFLSSSLQDILPALSVCFPEIEPIPSALRSIIDTLRYVFGLPAVRFTFEQVRKITKYRRRHSESREDLLQNLLEGKINLKEVPFDGVADLDGSNESKEENREESKHENPQERECYSLSDEAVVGNACALLVAGYETTNITLSLLAYEITRHQDVQERLREEINEQLAGETEITYEDLRKLNYMDQVISEILRIHPLNMIAITRIARESVKYKGMMIPKGMGISIPTYCLHRNPSSWPNPEKFDPERFSAENQALNPSLYQPFGFGPKSCLGKRFAQIVLKLTLAKLIRSYRLKSYSDEVKELKVKYSLIFSSPLELLLKVEPVSQQVEPE